MKEIKKETFIYNDLGFPILLINAPLRKVFGEWMLDLNLNKLQLSALNALIRKASPLKGAEMHFIRAFLEMTTAEFGKLFGVSHAAVVKWEHDLVKINPATELCIRLYVADHLYTKDKEFRKLYQNITVASLLKHKEDKSVPLEIHADEQMLLAC